jgi:hypothetical protein
VADIWKEIDGFIFEGQNVPKECVSVVFFMDIEILKFTNTKLSAKVGHQSSRLEAPYSTKTDISNTSFAQGL